MGATGRPRDKKDQHDARAMLLLVLLACACLVAAGYNPVAYAGSLIAILELIRRAVSP